MLLSLLISLALALTLLGLAYLYTLSLASLLPRPRVKTDPHAYTRFAAAIPAHDEAVVIARTVATLLACDYPEAYRRIFVVADHCSDGTAQKAREAGAHVLVREQGERGKGAALADLFEHIFTAYPECQAVAVFDADTIVDQRFFQVMSGRLSVGADAVQGQHAIRNPGAGWFPALTWAMFIIDNQFGNLGRANLGFSAKNMGDSICFRAEVLKHYGWGRGLTEDFDFRLKLLLAGKRIAYEPAAVGHGDAAVNWREASLQRQRWLRGSYQASRHNAHAMLREGLKRLDPALLDAAVYAYLPSYSTLTLIASLFLVLSLSLRAYIWPWLPGAWLVVFVLLFIFPLVNLAMARAPLKAFLVILTGPVYIIWRSALAFYARFLRRQVDWVRTPRHIQDE